VGARQTAPLPPGQTAIGNFPRFGVPAFADRWPSVPDAPSLQISGLVEAPITLDLGALTTLPRIEIVADFHCVTTWTSPGLRWSGYRLADVLDRIVAPQARPAANARYLGFQSLDGYRVCIDRRDVDADTLLADRLDGAPLSLEHGAPLRVIAPALYGYKSAKHVRGIEFLAGYRRGRAERQTLAHPRGRVAYEERGRFLPGWVYRRIYRALVPGTLAHFARAAKRRDGAGPPQ
jgi:DMSO/TMAO reductase YedYZ molybdopterin-dependent catalytic subunit